MFRYEITRGGMVVWIVSERDEADEGYIACIVGSARNALYPRFWPTVHVQVGLITHTVRS